MRFYLKQYESEAVAFDKASGDTHYLTPLANTVHSVLVSNPGVTTSELLSLVAQRLDLPTEPFLEAQIKDIVVHLHRIGLVHAP